MVSHDRDVLDACIDHVLVLNRASIEVQTGNFSSWWENKEKADSNARVENEKHLKEIGKLEVAAERAGRWAEKSENTKIGFDPIKEHDRSIDTRGYIGAKTKKMQKRVKERSDEAGNEMWFPVMIKYLEGAPFFKAHGYIGMEGLVKHLEHRVDLERRILREVFEGYYEIIERKIGLENTNI